MTTRVTIDNKLTWFYDLIVSEEDTRVCKDIPDEACADQPRNFFAYLIANLLNKISDELVSARLTLPWLFSVLGVPVSFIGFLIPIREACVLLPQLLVAAYVRAMSKRKIVWLIGALFSAVTLLIMAVVVWYFDGVLAGWLILACLVLYSLARGLCSVSAKDVLGKTISKTRRGRLMGYSVAIAGFFTLLIGLLMQFDLIAHQQKSVLLTFIVLSAVFWLFACLSFNAIEEPNGATGGGGNALNVALQSFSLLSNDKLFQQYVISRILLLSVALISPFYVILVQQELQGELSTLGWLIIINGLASSLSAPLIGRFADENSRHVMTVAASSSGIVGICIWLISLDYIDIKLTSISVFTAFFLVTLAHGAIRLGRKVYLVDMANTDNRAQYVALSNTIIGIAMLFGGFVGVLADLFSVQTVILLLSLLSIIAAIYTGRLKNVSG